MVISFEEKDRAAIEAKGMTVIEFKRILYKTGKDIEHAWEVLKECASKIAKAWSVFVEGFLEAVDSIKLVFEQVRETYHYPTSQRYRIAKVFSKCTGTDIRFGWQITWKIKRWLARSFC